MTIWLVLTLTTGLTISEPVTSVVECQIRGVEAQQVGRATDFRCAIGNRPTDKTEI